MMAASRAAVCAILLSSCILCLAQSQNSSASAPAPSLGTDIPIVRIQARVPLPKLPVLEDSYTLNIGVARIMGPGDNTSADDPYVDFTGRVYNHQLVTGLVRVKQGRGACHLLMPRSLLHDAAQGSLASPCSARLSLAAGNLACIAGLPSLGLPTLALNESDLRGRPLMQPM